MTPPPGRSAHHEGDGCTGKHRTVDLEGAEDIGYHARRLLVCAATGRPREAVSHGEWAAVHYGAPGEFFLCTELVRRVCQGRPSTDAPSLSWAVPDGDLEAAALLESTAAHRRLATPPAEQHAAFAAARLQLQTFALHLHSRNTREAEWQWARLCEQADHAPLLLPAFRATLAVWAARATFGSRQLAARTAPLD
jgi:hypothetical protein